MMANGILARRENSYRVVDSMSPEMKACVHEYGYAIIHACLEAGVSKPNSIRQLVREIWAGARQPAQRVGGHQNRSSMVNQIDWVLLQAEAKISAATLIRILADGDLVIVPREPSPPMLRASLDAVHHMGRVTKTQKHANRLRAAIAAAAVSLRAKNGGTA